MALVRQVYELDPEDPVTMYHLANSLLGMQDLKRARTMIEKLLRVAGDDSAVLLLAGRLALRSRPKPEELPTVRRFFERALRQRPDMTEARYFLGVCQMEGGNYEAARGTFEYVVAEIPTYRQAYQQLAQVYQRLGEPDRAEDARRAYDRLNAENRHAGEIRRRAAREPNNLDAQLALGRLALEQDHVQLAQVTLAHALTLAPTSSEVRQALAEAYRRAGRVREADEVAAGR